jgi:cyclophilin family peptidyl-prolyl cis-trans isomerase/HEAT repeat protein
VAYALQRIEDKRALPALLTLAGSANQETQAFAIKGLGAMGDASAVETLLPLLEPARAVTPPGIEAIRALARLRDSRAEPALMKLLYVRGLNPMVRAETLMALGESDASVNVDAFVDFLGDPLPVVRVAALRGFSKREDETFLTVLSGLDPDPHWSVRAALAGVLAEKDAERALPRLEAMLTDQDTRVVPAVLHALTKLKAPGIEKILLERLSAEDVLVRATAAVGIGELKPEGGVEALAEAYKRGQVDLVFDTRTTAIEALAKYGAAAMPTLKTALSDKDWVVRTRAASLIKTLDPSIDAAADIRPAPASRPVNYESPALLTPTVSPHVYIDTARGSIEIELDVLDAPLTADNFITLARKGYFDGLSFHRVVPNFVVQTGDPRGDGEGGPGYSIRDELNQEPFVRGTVGMALAGRDTGGSQFFITLAPQPHLDARYTVFGRVVSGMEVADALVQGEIMSRVRVWDGGE